MKLVSALIVLVSSAILSAPASAATIQWHQSQGQDCKVTCNNAGMSPWMSSSQFSPVSWGQWGNRSINLCGAPVSGTWLFGYNLGARQGGTVDSAVCNIGGGNTQHKISVFWCQCH